jgi:hypothetical protein
MHKTNLTSNDRDTWKFVSRVGLDELDGSSCVVRKGPFVLGGSEMETRLSRSGVLPD